MHKTCPGMTIKYHDLVRKGELNGGAKSNGGRKQGIVHFSGADLLTIDKVNA